MKFKLCSNGQAILLSREMKMLDRVLTLEFGLDEGYTAIISNAGGVFYKTIINGVAELESNKIRDGVISIVIVKNSEIKPTWICDELYAVSNGINVAVAGNTLQYDEILTDLRVKNDGLREQVERNMNELASLREHYEKIYAGYQIL